MERLWTAQLNEYLKTYRDFLELFGHHRLYSEIVTIEHTGVGLKSYRNSLVFRVYVEERGTEWNLESESLMDIVTDGRLHLERDPRL